MHQPPSKGERSTARFTGLSQQGREEAAGARTQPSSCMSESIGEGRKFLREAARQAGQNGQAPIPNSPCALRNTKHAQQPWRSWGDATLDRRGSHSQVQDTVLCVMKSRNISLGRGCWLTSSYSCALQSPKSSVPEQPCCWTLLLTRELWVLTQPLHHGDLSCPCHFKRPRWILATFHTGMIGLRFPETSWENLGSFFHLSFSGRVCWCCAQNNKPTGESALTYWILQGSLNTNYHLISTLKIAGGRVQPQRRISYLEEQCSGNHLTFTTLGRRNLPFISLLLGIKEIH